jgi:hypothetical protein
VVIVPEFRKMAAYFVHSLVSFKYYFFFYVGSCLFGGRNKPVFF